MNRRKLLSFLGVGGIATAALTPKLFSEPIRPSSPATSMESMWVSGVCGYRVFDGEYMEEPRDWKIRKIQMNMESFSSYREGGSLHDGALRELGREQKSFAEEMRRWSESKPCNTKFKRPFGQSVRCPKCGGRNAEDVGIEI